jgi:hypothetical protein
LNREHVFARWLGPLFGTDRIDSRVEHMLKRGESPGVMWSARGFHPDRSFWIGHYGDANSGVIGLSSTVTHAPEVFGAHVSTFALGQFAIQIFAERRTAGLRGEFAYRSGAWNDTLIEIWPPPTVPLIRGIPVMWPPEHALTRETFQNLFERFLAPDE